MKKSIILSLTAAILLVFVSCSESKKENKKNQGTEKDKAFTAEVQKMTDLKCESEGILIQMRELQVKYAKSPTMLIEADLLSEKMALCEFIDEETIAKFKSKLVKGFLDSKGENLYLEYILDDEGLEIGYAFKDENNEIVGSMEKTELSEDVKADINNYADLFCRFNELNKTIMDMYAVFEDSNKDDKGFSEKFKLSAKELLSKCQDISPEKLEELIKQL